MCFHEVQFYEHEAFLVARVAGHVSAALDAGNAAIVIATPAHRAAFAGQLQRDGVDTRERFMSLDARQTLEQFMVNDWPDEGRFTALLGDIISQATRGGALRLHAFGEMVALLCADGKPQAALRLEELWNELATQHAFSLLCAYPVEAFGAEAPSEVFDAICAAHSHVSPCEEYQALLADPDRFHRTMARLQHKAQSLEHQIMRREEAERAISRLAAHQEHIREEERKRIAREIHDELGGLLTGIKAYVSVAQERCMQQGLPSDPQLADAADLADTALANVRRIITDLRPSVLDQLGVWAAIEWYAGQIEKQAGLTCRVDIDEAEVLAQLDAKSSNAVFRIVQEALTNVVRHAGASRVDIQVRQADGAVTVAVVDNGNGLVRMGQRESWGIAGMHERARHCGAELKMIPMPAQGTTVALRLPWPPGHRK
jgi:signal transduction histidine kinase